MRACHVGTENALYPTPEWPAQLRGNSNMSQTMKDIVITACELQAERNPRETKGIRALMNDAVASVARAGFSETMRKLAMMRRESPIAAAMAVIGILNACAFEVRREMVQRVRERVPSKNMPIKDDTGMHLVDLLQSAPEWNESQDERQSPFSAWNDEELVGAVESFFMGTSATTSVLDTPPEGAWQQGGKYYGTWQEAAEAWQDAQTEKWRPLSQY